MKGKNLIILVVAAAVLCGAAYLSNTKKTGKDAGASRMGEPLFPHLEDPDNLNSIKELVFLTSGSTVTVERANDKWVSPDKYGYPVDFDKLRTFVRKVAGLKIGQVVPSGPKQTERLNLVSPDAATPEQAEQTGTRVSLNDKEGKPVATLLVGKEHMRQPPASAPASPFGGYGGGYPDGRYVSVGTDVYLLTETLSSIPDNGNAWLDTSLANVPAADIVEIHVDGPGGTNVTLSRPGGSGDLTVTDLAENEEMDSSKVSGLAGLLSYLTFTDVVNPALTDEELGFATPTRAMLTTKDGKVYTVELGGGPEDSEDRYVRLSAAYTPPAEPAPEPDAETPDVAQAIPVAGNVDTEQAKKKEAHEKLAKEVAELNAKAEGWTYRVSSYKVDKVTADRRDLVKEKPEEEPEDVGDSADDDAAEPEADAPVAAEAQETEAPVDPPAVPAVETSTQGAPAVAQPAPVPALPPAVESPASVSSASQPVAQPAEQTEVGGTAVSLPDPPSSPLPQEPDGEAVREDTAPEDK